MGQSQSYGDSKHHYFAFTLSGDSRTTVSTNHAHPIRCAEQPSCSTVLLHADPAPPTHLDEGLGQATIKGLWMQAYIET